MQSPPQYDDKSAPIRPFGAFQPVAADASQEQYDARFVLALQAYDDAVALRRALVAEDRDPPDPTLDGLTGSQVAWARYHWWSRAAVDELAAQCPDDPDPAASVRALFERVHSNVRAHEDLCPFTWFQGEFHDILLESARSLLKPFTLDKLVAAHGRSCKTLSILSDGRSDRERAANANTSCCVVS